MPIVIFALLCGGGAGGGAYGGWFFREIAYVGGSERIVTEPVVALRSLCKYEIQTEDDIDERDEAEQQEEA